MLWDRRPGLLGGGGRIVQAGRLHLPLPVVEGIGHVSTETSRC